MGKYPFQRSRQRVYSLCHVKNCNMVPVHSSCPTILSTASAPQYCESSLYCSHVPGQYHVTSWAAKHGGSWLALHHPPSSSLCNMLGILSLVTSYYWPMTPVPWQVRRAPFTANWKCQTITSKGETGLVRWFKR